MSIGAYLCCAIAAVVVWASAEEAWASSTPAGPDPALAGWEEWSYPVTCSSPDQAFDPLTAFSGLTGAELGSSPAEQGLRAEIEGTKDWYEPIPAHGWRRIAESEAEAQFTRGRLSGQLEWLALARDTDGKWGFHQSSSDCEPTVSIEGGTVVTWSLARKQKHLTPQTQTLWIDLGPGECASGARQNPRARFRFRTMGKRLLMIAWLKPVGGGAQTCEGTIEPSRRVHLPQPLGEYRLFDGATFPPVPAVKTRSRYY